jgi:hypothetical protein
MSMTLSTAWEQVGSLRESVGDSLLFAPDEVKDATVMTAAELVENTIKHGAHGAGEKAMFSMRIEDGQVVLEVSNTVPTEHGAADLIQRVARIAAAPDKSELYLARMTELMTNPEARGGIGLYRIAFEGQFDLEARRQGSVVTVRATRRLP